ncbi:MAG: DNA mismatch repair protein MutS [Candidatus Saelkia tenebricola]|nr:DNA mismatch repair protein MutS [Candidatus Saelkia tenebricola]
MKEQHTPMLNQYLKIKKDFPDIILFFRLGDFYEMFFEDAKLASSVLHITLTSRGKIKGTRIPMCGVPHHAAENYIRRLLKAGYKVAVCEQVEDPKTVKGIVKREVVKVITPGTLVAESLVEENNNYIIAVNEENNKFGLSLCDISTGEFKTTELDSKEELFSEIMRLNPSEYLLPEDRQDLKKLVGVNAVTEYPDFHFILSTAGEMVLNHFNVATLSGFGLDGRILAISTAGALLKYLQGTQKKAVEHIKKIEVYSVKNYMVLDSFTQRNLELVKNCETGTKEGALLSVLDKTYTSMGKRRIEQWVLQPLIEKEKICNRHDGVSCFYEDQNKRHKVQEILKGIQDLERIAARIGLSTAGPRDLISLKNSLEKAKELKENISGFDAAIIRDCFSRLDPLKEIVRKISEAIVEEPPVVINEGGIIKKGYRKDLDELQEVLKSGKDWIAQLQEKEIRRTGISSLKIGYNKVFGYYIVITNSNLKSVPPDYIRKQTLVNAERFITPELKEYEEKILGAEEKSKELEKEIFINIRDDIKQYIVEIQENARAMSVIDILQSFAQIAEDNKYIRPKINSGLALNIKDSRHPVLEKVISENTFIPNDIFLGDERILIITGPNMAGKSTYIRQVALLVIMSQIGCFIPAAYAEIGIVDKVFTRIGAHDALISGMSTFMVEMVEVAWILNNATANSLIILDEVGRGTSTYDGLSIAWSVVEFIHKYIKAKTLFATHYHELTQIAKYFSEVGNLNTAVREYKNEVVFLYRIEAGICDKSFGIHVAKLAGVPNDVIERAKKVLKDLEFNRNHVPSEVKELQAELFTTAVHPLIEELKMVDVEKTTPLEALDILNRFIRRLDSEEKND